ncbi:MAG TPA: FAD-dependent oxidoreductase [Mycobacterium sp.]|nr:FAD-dependent oxidoreductase [Mycobacterium sp.]
MSRTTTYVIVGAGLAGAKAAEALRDNDFDGHIVLIGAEELLPYERPPLSKEFLAGKKGLEEFTVHNAAWYRDHDVELRLGTEITGIERPKQAVTLPDGEALSYDKLLLATGSRSRRPKLTGAGADRVYYLRTYPDAEAISAALTDGAALGIVGGGWIGLEVAAGARDRGVAVTVVEAAELPLLGAMGPEMAQVFADLHREHGVDLRCKTGVAEITTIGNTASGLALDDGAGVAADAVLVAVGAAPNIEIAEAAGLQMADGGVAVDASLRTSDPNIYAVGDIAAAEHPLLDTRIRTEHWANALKQPPVAAAAMMGRHAVYDELPYFFTDQYDLGMEYVGHSAGYRKVLTRGDVKGREFTAFWLDGDDRVLAGMNVNVWEGLDDIKAVIRNRRPVDTGKLTDPDQPLAGVGT